MKGVDVNVKDEDGWTPLRWAIKKGYQECSKTIIKHRVLRNHETEKPFYITNNPTLSEYWDNCQNEVRKMQNEKIGDIDSSSVSFYQFLSETDPNKLAGYLSNENTNVREELKKDTNMERWKNIFPLYADIIESMIKSQYDEGMERKDLLSKGEIILKHSDLKVLPEDARSKVISLLSNAVLEKIKIAGVQAVNQKSL